MSGKRASVEIAGLVLACFGVFFAYTSGKNEAIAEIRRDSLDRIAVIETVSRYISTMGGTAASGAGKRTSYSLLVGGHNISNAEISGLEVDGKLLINEPAVAIFQELAAAFPVDPKSPARSEITKPLSLLSQSSDPTLVAGGAVALSRIYTNHPPVRRNEDFKSSIFQFVELKDLNLSYFRLDAADFRRARVEKVSVAACDLSQANFNQSRLVELEITDLVCDKDNSKLAINLEGARLGSAGRFGILIDSESFGASVRDIELLVSRAESDGESRGVSCTGKPNRSIDLTLVESVDASLHRSKFNYCNLVNQSFLADAIFENSEFNNGKLSGSVFGINSLRGAKLNFIDLSESNVAFSGISSDDIGVGSTVDDAVFLVDSNGADGSPKLIDKIGPNGLKLSKSSVVWFVDSVGKPVGYGVNSTTGAIEYQKDPTYVAKKVRSCTKCDVGWFTTSRLLEKPNINAVDPQTDSAVSDS